MWWNAFRYLQFLFEIAIGKLQNTIFLGLPPEKGHKNARKAATAFRVLKSHSGRASNGHGRNRLKSERTNTSPQGNKPQKGRPIHGEGFGT